MGCCHSTTTGGRDGEARDAGRNAVSFSSRQRSARREMDGRFRQHQSRGHRQTMSSEYIFGVKNPFAKFVGKEEGEEKGGASNDEEEISRNDDDDDEGEISLDRASSTNTIDSSNNTQGEETEETEESEGALNDQMRLLKKERKLSDDREGGKMEFLSAAFMRRGFGVGAGSNANDNNKNSKSKHRRTESEPPPKVTGRGNNSNNSSNNSGKEQPSGRTSRMSRLVSETADDSYKAFEDDGEDEQQTQIEQKNALRRSMTTNATLSTGPTAATRHFRSLSVSAAKFERGLDGSNVGKDLRASIFEALEKSNTNKEDVPQQLDRPATPFDDNNCCPTCLEEYHDDNPKITLACAHHFHLACIVEWNERGHSECPMCMTDVGFYIDDGN